MNAQLRDARAFLGALFPDAGAIVERRTLNPFARQTWHTDPDELARLCLTASDAGANVYVGINRRTAIGAGDAEGVRSAGAFVADFDGKHVTAIEPAAMIAEVRDRIDRAMMPVPSMINWSGRGVHCYWLLVAALADLDLWESIQDAIITTLGSDPAIKDRARIMRVPGTVNQKPGGGPSYTVELDADRRYEVDDVACVVWHANTPDERQPDPAAIDDAIGNKPERKGGVGGQVIDEFNARTPIRPYYASEGYDVVGHRFRRPGKRGREFNGIFRLHGRGREVACHFSTLDKLNDLKFGKGRTMGIHDAFSAFCLLRHGGNLTAAVMDAARRLGIPLPKHQRDGDVFKAAATGPDGAEFESLWFGDAENAKLANFADSDTRLLSILTRHTTNPKQIARLLEAAARARAKGAA